MGLGEHTITNWDDMRKIFLKKYQAYCKSKDSKDDIFRMSHQEDESLEEDIEWFRYNLQKYKHSYQTADITWTIFLKGIRDEYLDVLNVMGKGDISYLPFDEIAKLCQKYSRGRERAGNKDVISKITKSNTGSITRDERGILLEDFKTDLLSTLGT